MSDPLPRAEVGPAPRFSVIWLVPLLAMALALVLGWQAWGQGGVEILIDFGEGHGLKAGDTLRHRGIVVGRVDAVRLSAGGDGVRVIASLEPEASDLARVGSRFWVVRPQLGLDAVGGLDTLVGDRYLGALPGQGPPQRQFDGLPAAPIADALEPGIDVVLESSRRGSLRPGSPVTYRGIHVGSVLSVGLASDSRTVEVGVRVLQAYGQLVRPGTRFWDSGGVDFEVGLTGFSLHLDNLQQLALGGVSLAVPEDAGAPVSTGRRFPLFDRPEKEWLGWRASLPIGHSLLPAGAALAEPLRAALAWREGRVFTGDERREGWALALPGALLLPDDLVSPPAGAHEGSPRLELAGLSLDPGTALSRPAPGLALMPGPEQDQTRPWPRASQRHPDAPEDCLAIGDPSAPPLSLAAGRFRETEDGWELDPALPLDDRWHGAVLLARSDGRLIGMLLVHGELRRAVLLPGPLP